ncbi:helix-turn-helix domain-containing protein [Dehalococcoidia bacterium]|nr:helix-turn-helix domain-containing protein [Dehalococcoidia bacterium]
MAFKPDPPPDVYLIKDLEQLQALADPLHLRLLELLSQKAMTVTQVANLLDEKPNRLYYHINKLEEVGLVRLVETRPYRGILEKYYQAVAENFKIDESVIQLQKEKVGTLYDLAQGVFEATMADLRQTLRAKLQEESPESSVELKHHIERTHIRLPREKVKEVYEKVMALGQELRDAQPHEGGEEYGLTVVFYPVVRPDQKSPQEEKGE